MKFFFGFLVGAAIGGAAAVLLLQEETREALLGKAREAGDFAMDATQDLRGKVNDATSDIRGKVNAAVNEAASQWQTNASDLYARGKQVVDEARSTIDSAVQEGKAAAGQARDDIKWRKEV